MKNIFRIFVFSLVLVLSTAKSQFVTLPDTVFRNFLISQYPTCFNTNKQLNTTCTLIKSAQSLNVCSLGISDLTGLQYFTNLVNLCCKSNKLTSLPTLPTKLVSLVGSDNNLTALPSLPTTLATLSVKKNKLTSLPTLPSTLVYLDCSNNSITALPTLPTAINTVLANNNCYLTIPVKPALSFLSTFVVSPNLSSCPTDLKDDVQAEESLSLYPNPNKGKFIVSSKEESNLKIINAKGEIVLQKTLIIGENDIDITSLKSGVYMARSNSQQTKFVIE
ncbi:MAG: T9SS type A sorting domain-containing protein [Cytophagales bacterium]